MLTYDELTLIAKALEHYEGCGIADDMEDQFRTDILTATLGTSDMKLAIKEADRIVDNLRATIDTRKEQCVLLRAKLIGLKDKAIADEL